MEEFKKLGYASWEELYFSWWLQEMIEEGYIERVVYQPERYILSEPVIMEYQDVKKTKTNIKTKQTIHKHHYTLDWDIVWCAKAENVLFECYGYDATRNTITVKNGSIHFLAEYDSKENRFISRVDVKGSFAGKNNTSAATYPLNAKWMFKDFGIYVNKIVPEKLFKKTFAPARFFMNDGGGAMRKKRVQGKMIPIIELNIYSTVEKFLQINKKEPITNKLF